MRWLRPEYQNKGSTRRHASEDGCGGGRPFVVASPTALRTWPDELPAQAAALTEVLGSLNVPASVEDIAAHFEGKRTKKKVGRDDEVAGDAEGGGACGGKRRWLGEFGVVDATPCNFCFASLGPKPMRRVFEDGRPCAVWEEEAVPLPGHRNPDSRYVGRGGQAVSVQVKGLVDHTGLARRADQLGPRCSSRCWFGPPFGLLAMGAHRGKKRTLVMVMFSPSHLSRSSLVLAEARWLWMTSNKPSPAQLHPQRWSRVDRFRN